MNNRVACCFLALLGITWPASAQNRLILGEKQTREFPTEDCSFTLPDKDWEWLDPRLVPGPPVKALACAGNWSGLKVVIRCDPIKPSEVVTQRTYANFAADMTRSGKWKKLGAKHVSFQGVPSYRLDLESARDGSCHRLLIAYSNNRAYVLQVINTRGSIGWEADGILENFAFTAPRKPMLQPHDENDDPNNDDNITLGSLPQRAGAWLWSLGSVGFVCLIIFGAWTVLRLRTGGG
ncbi:MAG TPA: hypothetical protein VKE40_20420 [Gemmataceae bacterium]|nr:hypothetical protein [Gemmataceae bacterium]